MAAVVAKNCTADGDGLTGFTAQQVRTSFTIYAADASGTRLRSGGATFKVVVRGQAPVKETITDQRDGTYLVQLTYPQSGKYEVAISHNFNPIQGSPFSVQVQAARRPAPPPPPRLGVLPVGAAAGSVPRSLEWDPPAHNGGMPIEAYRIWSLSRELTGGEPTLLATVAGDVFQHDIPGSAAAPLSSMYYGFAVSAQNAKGESDPSKPGPEPRGFDGRRCAAERAALARLHQASGPGAVEIEAYTGAAATDKGVAAAARTARPPAPEVAGPVLRRLGAAAKLAAEAEEGLTAEFGDGGMPAEAAAATMALPESDVIAAGEQAEGVARLLHVWDVISESEAAGAAAVTGRAYAACAAADPGTAAVLASLPSVREAISGLAHGQPEQPVHRKALELLLLSALPPLQVEREARGRQAALDALRREAEERRKMEEAEAERKRKEEEEEARRRAEAEAAARLAAEEAERLRLAEEQAVRERAAAVAETDRLQKENEEAARAWLREVEQRSAEVRQRIEACALGSSVPEIEASLRELREGYRAGTWAEWDRRRDEVGKGRLVVEARRVSEGRGESEWDPSDGALSGAWSEVGAADDAFEAALETRRAQLEEAERRREEEERRRAEEAAEAAARREATRREAEGRTSRVVRGERAAQERRTGADRAAGQAMAAAQVGARAAAAAEAQAARAEAVAAWAAEDAMSVFKYENERREDEARHAAAKAEAEATIAKADAAVFAAREAAHRLAAEVSRLRAAALAEDGRALAAAASAGAAEAAAEADEKAAAAAAQRAAKDEEAAAALLRAAEAERQAAVTARSDAAAQTSQLKSLAAAEVQAVGEHAAELAALAAQEAGGGDEEESLHRSIREAGRRRAAAEAALGSFDLRLTVAIAREERCLKELALATAAHGREREAEEAAIGALEVEVAGLTARKVDAETAAEAAATAAAAAGAAAAEAEAGLLELRRDFAEGRSALEAEVLAAREAAERAITDAAGAGAMARVAVAEEAAAGEELKRRIGTGAAMEARAAAAARRREQLAAQAAAVRHRAGLKEASELVNTAGGVRTVLADTAGGRHDKHVDGAEAVLTDSGGREMAGEGAGAGLDGESVAVAGAGEKDSATDSLRTEGLVAGGKTALTHDASASSAGSSAGAEEVGDRASSEGVRSGDGWEDAPAGTDAAAGAHGGTAAPDSAAAHSAATDSAPRSEVASGPVGGGAGGVDVPMNEPPPVLYSSSVADEVAAAASALHSLPVSLPKALAPAFPTQVSSALSEASVASAARRLSAFDAWRARSEHARLGLLLAEAGAAAAAAAADERAADEAEAAAATRGDARAARAAAAARGLAVARRAEVGRAAAAMAAAREAMASKIARLAAREREQIAWATQAAEAAAGAMQYTNGDATGEVLRLLSVASPVPLAPPSAEAVARLGSVAALRPDVGGGGVEGGGLSTGGDGTHRGRGRDSGAGGGAGAAGSGGEATGDGAQIVSWDHACWLVRAVQLDKERYEFLLTAAGGAAAGRTLHAPLLYFLLGGQQWRATIDGAPPRFVTRRCDLLAPPPPPAAAADLHAAKIDHSGWDGGPREWRLPAHLTPLAQLPLPRPGAGARPVAGSADALDTGGGGTPAGVPAAGGAPLLNRPAEGRFASAGWAGPPGLVAVPPATTLPPLLPSPAAA